MKTNPKPMPGNLVVERLPEADRTASGLYVTSDPQKSAYLVQVRRVTAPKDIGDMDEYFKPGDILMIGKWQGTECQVRKPDGTATTFLIINESSVLAIMEEEDEGGATDNT